MTYEIIKMKKIYTKNYKLYAFVYKLTCNLKLMLNI